MPSCKLPYHLQEPVAQILDFVRDNLVSDLRITEPMPQFDFVVNESSEQGARVIEPLPGQYRVYIDAGLLIALDELFQIDAKHGDIWLHAYFSTLSDAAGDTETAVSLCFVAAIVFVLLHEIFHALAGHLACYQEHYAPGDPGNNVPDAYTPSHIADVSDNASRELSRSEFLTLIELEADGAAYDTTLQFSSEITSLVGCSKLSDSPITDELQSGMILGALGAIGLLQGRWPIREEHVSEHPFPDIRALNVCSAHFRATTRHLVHDQKSLEYRLRQKDEELDRIIDRYQTTILPAIFALDRLLSHRYDRAPYIRQGNIADDEPTTSLANNIAKVLGGGEPDSSESGQEFTCFISLQSIFIPLMADYRKTDSW